VSSLPRAAGTATASIDTARPESRHSRCRTARPAGRTALTETSGGVGEASVCREHHRTLRRAAAPLRWLPGGGVGARPARGVAILLVLPISMAWAVCADDVAVVERAIDEGCRVEVIAEVVASSIPRASGSPRLAPNRCVVQRGFVPEISFLVQCRRFPLDTATRQRLRSLAVFAERLKAVHFRPLAVAMTRRPGDLDS
jgi:hypothetical protein